MLITLVIIVIVIAAVWLFMFFTRKTLWDQVHQNLLDVEDNYNGHVVRNGLASRPVFKGDISGKELTINFSTEKTPDGRKNYCNISLNISSKYAATLTKKSWLLAQNEEELPEFYSLKVQGTEWTLMPKVENLKKLSQNKQLLSIVENLQDVTYLFVGKGGVISEFEIGYWDKETTFTHMQRRLEFIQKLTKLINKN